MTLNICPTVLYALATVHLTFFYSSLRATSTIDMYTLKKAIPTVGIACIYFILPFTLLAYFQLIYIVLLVFFMNTIYNTCIN